MSWKDDLSEEFKESPAFKDIGNDINDLAKNFLDAQSHLGNAIRIPSAEASPEDITAFHTRLQEKVPGLIPTPDKENTETIDMFLSALGKPESSDKYALPEVEGIQIDEARGELIKKTAHEMGLTQDQLSGFLSKMYEADLGVSDITANERQTDALALKKEWGVTHGPKMEALTKNMLLTEAPAELVQAFKDGLVDSATVKWFDKIFGTINEGSELSNQGKGGDESDGVDVAEAIERAAEIRRKMTAPGAPTIGPEYTALLAKLVKYEKMAHPDSSSDINDLRVGLRSG